MMRRMSSVVVAAAVIFVAGCASLGRATFKEPIVTFKDARITGLGVTGGSIEVVLDVYNPNRFRLDGTKLTYKVLVDSTTFGQGEYLTRFEVSEQGTNTVRLPFNFSYAGVGAARRQITQTGAVEYRVIGDLTVSTPIGNFTRPYDQKGKFSALQGTSR